jgi:hypothetical protein
MFRKMLLLLTGGAILVSGLGSPVDARAAGDDDESDPGDALDLRPSRDARFDPNMHVASRGGEADPDFDQEPVEDFDLGIEDVAGVQDRAGRLHGPAKNEFSVAGLDPDDVAIAVLEGSTAAVKEPCENAGATLSAVSHGAVLVELPILAARSRADFGGKPYWLVAEVFVQGEKVSEWRQEVTAASLAIEGPTFFFLKTQVAVPARQGVVELRLSKEEDGVRTALLARKLPFDLR